MARTALNPVPDSIRPMFEALIAMPYFRRRLGIRKYLKPPPAAYSGERERRFHAIVNAQ